MPVGCTIAGLGNVAKIEKAVFYPNPFTNSVQLTNATGNSSELKVYNTLGKLVMTRTINGANATIETGFTAGMYFYSLVDETGKVQTGKLIKN
jgi:hypothetical protein